MPTTPRRPGPRDATSAPERNVFADPGDAPRDDERDASPKLFDLRLLIGGLFTLYGVILAIASPFTTSAQRAKADGINMNLWLGLGMLAVGVAFLAWARLRPLRTQEPSALSRAAGDRAGR